MWKLEYLSFGTWYTCSYQFDTDDKALDYGSWFKSSGYVTQIRVRPVA